MKKIFAFAMAIVSMAAVMTSCNNDEADFIEQPAPVAPKVQDEVVNTDFDGTLYFCAYDEQFDYINCEYEVTVGGETMMVNVENLQATSTIVKSIEKSLKKMEETDSQFVHPTIYVYHIPAGMKGEVTVRFNFSIKEGVELPELVKVARGCASNGECKFRSSEYESEYLQQGLDVYNGSDALKEMFK